MNNATDPAQAVHTELVAWLNAAASTSKLFEHPISKTSDESLEARYKVSGERVPGAKAILIKMGMRDAPDSFAVIVLPGSNLLDSKTLKRELRTRVPGMHSFRFATPEEMAQKARGMQPGKMPPFGRPIFPDVAFTFIDQALLDHKRVGFNAAHFERSIIIDTEEYLRLVTHDGIFACSVEVAQQA